VPPNPNELTVARIGEPWPFASFLVSVGTSKSQSVEIDVWGWACENANCGNAALLNTKAALISPRSPRSFEMSDIRFQRTYQATTVDRPAPITLQSRALRSDHPRRARAVRLHIRNIRRLSLYLLKVSRINVAWARPLEPPRTVRHAVLIHSGRSNQRIDSISLGQRAVNMVLTERLPRLPTGQKPLPTHRMIYIGRLARGPPFWRTRSHYGVINALTPRQSPHCNRHSRCFHTQDERHQR